MKSNYSNFDKRMVFFDNEKGHSLYIKGDENGKTFSVYSFRMFICSWSKTAVRIDKQINYLNR